MVPVLLQKFFLASLVWFNALEMIQRVWFSFAAAVVAAFGIFAAVPQKPPDNPTDKSLEAARLNNLGAAYMNQQLLLNMLKQILPELRH